MPQKDYSALYTPAAIVIAGIIIGVSVFFAFSGNTPSLGGNGAPTAQVNIEDVQLDGHPFIGDARAPVAIAYWSDYQCPFCKAVEMGHPQIPNIDPAIPEIIREYVDTGKVKIVFKDYAFLSEDSTTAALWGRAVWDLFPNKYWEWREAMYEAQDEEHGGFGDEASIRELTRGISGIDVAAVEARIGEKQAEYQQVIDADKAEGTAFGIQGTPGFIIGETLIPGAASFQEFKTAIEAVL